MELLIGFARECCGRRATLGAAVAADTRHNLRDNLRISLRINKKI
jgi:hypothetical protein